jgi:hypothetical protein
LEGGYDLQAAESCSLAVVAALLGEPIQQDYDQRLGTAENGEPSTFNAILEQAKLLWEIK